MWKYFSTWAFVVQDTLSQKSHVRRAVKHHSSNVLSESLHRWQNAVRMQLEGKWWVQFCDSKRGRAPTKQIRCDNWIVSLLGRLVQIYKRKSVSFCFRRFYTHCCERTFHESWTRHGELRLARFLERRRRARMVQSFRNLQTSCKDLRIRRHILQKAASKLRKRLHSKAFAAWKSLHMRSKAKRTAIKRAIYRIRTRTMFLSFARWQRFFHNDILREQSRRMRAANDLRRKVTLERFSSKMLVKLRMRAFVKMRNSCRKGIVMRRLTKKSIRYSELFLVRKCFKAWCVSPSIDAEFIAHCVRVTLFFASHFSLKLLYWCRISEGM